jgi:hypothetical protein
MSEPNRYKLGEGLRSHEQSKDLFMLCLRNAWPTPIKVASITLKNILQVFKTLISNTWRPHAERDCVLLWH